VNGVSAALDERNDPIQPSRAALKLQRSAWDQAEGPAYIGEKRWSKQGAVGNVQETKSSELLAGRFAARGFAIGPCRTGSGFLKRTPGRRFTGPSDQLAGTGFGDTENIR
jgi:hypothetical protein